MEIPLHQRPLKVNPQPRSSLYHDGFPAEIRNQIFHYAFIEKENIDPEDIHAPNTAYPVSYSRPGYRAKRTIPLALLLTCRRVYLETYHLPLLMKEHIFWHAPETGPPPGPDTHDRFGHDAENLFLTSLRRWQLGLVQEMTLFTQLFWLEQSFVKLCKEDYMQGIEKIKIVIRKTDWWWNEGNVPLSINPVQGIGGNPGHVNMMMVEIMKSQRGENSEWNMQGWGGAFARLDSLKELEIAFEAGDDKKNELLQITEWAKTWKFPLKENRVLSTEGCAMTTDSWTGPEYFWTRLCSQCHLVNCRHTRVHVDVVHPVCEERMRRENAGLGPLCHIYTLKWKAEDRQVRLPLDGQE